MILVDTSIWIDHFRRDNAILSALLRDTAVLTHPFVIGELAMGNLRQRDSILADLSNLPRAVAAQDTEVLRFIDREQLFGGGIGFVDAHLLAATRLTPHAALWTADKRLAATADRLALSARIMQ